MLLFDLIPDFIPMIILMSVAAFTPGPNNIMLAASGANYGFRRTIPHMMGITLGFALIIVLAGFVIAVFAAFPVIRQIFNILATAFVLWLAWRIAASTEASKASGRSRPMSFIEAASFQLINPKSIGMSATVVAAFVSPERAFMPQFLLLLVSFTFIAWLSTITWAQFGVMISGFINTPMRLRVFNITMAVLLVVSVLPILLEPILLEFF